MKNKIGIAILVIVSLFLPLFISDYWRYIFTLTFFYIIMASSWNLLSGYTGQFSLGHHTFAMVGAYYSTLLMQYTGTPFWLSIPTGIFVTIIISLLLGFVCLRVHGIFLALITWAFAQVSTNFVRMNFHFTGGDRGMDSPFLFGTMNPLPYYYLFLGLAILTIILIAWIMQSKIGVYFRSMREDPIAARSLGIDITKYKVLAFIISSGLAGMAGIFYSHTIGYVSPLMGDFNEMAMIILFVVIGGMRSIKGPIIGAVTVRILMELLREYGELRIIILSAIIIILMRFYPGGIVEIIKTIKKTKKWTMNDQSKPISAYQEAPKNSKI